MIVIAIIAVLAAITFAIATKAISKAKQTDCIALMRNITIGMEEYYMEHNRPPLPRNKDDEDTIFGEPNAEYTTEPLMNILTGGSDLTWTEPDNGDTFDMEHLNPKRVQYVKIQEVPPGKKESGLWDDGRVYDPWGRELMFAINSRVQVTQSNDGFQDEMLDTQGFAEWAEIQPNMQPYVMWSYGADGIKGRGTEEFFKGSDDVKSF